MLWLALDASLWATTGPRCQLLRARGGTFEQLHPRSAGSSRELEVHKLEALEGDTFVVLDDERWAKSVREAFLRPPEVRPVAPTLREELRRRFVTRLALADVVEVRGEYVK